MKYQNASLVNLILVYYSCKGDRSSKMTGNYQLYLSMWMANSTQNNNLISKAEKIKLKILRVFSSII